MRRAAILVLLAATLAGCGSSSGEQQITIGAERARPTAGQASVKVGPGPVAEVVNENGYRLEFHVSPNRAAVQNAFAVRITRSGTPVRGARVITRVAMLDMEMGSQRSRLAETSPGVYEQSLPALLMAGHWALSFEITRPGKAPFTVLLVDRAAG